MRWLIGAFFINPAKETIAQVFFYYVIQLSMWNRQIYLTVIVCIGVLFLSNHLCAQGLKFQRDENSIENRTSYNGFAYKSRMFKDRLDISIDYVSAL